MAAGSTGERPFFEIITSIRYWVIHAVTLPAIFLLDSCLCLLALPMTHSELPVLTLTSRRLKARLLL